MGWLAALVTSIGFAAFVIGYTKETQHREDPAAERGLRYLIVGTILFTLGMVGFGIAGQILRRWGRG